MNRTILKIGLFDREEHLLCDAIFCHDNKNFRPVIHGKYGEKINLLKIAYIVPLHVENKNKEK